MRIGVIDYATITLILNPEIQPSNETYSQIDQTKVEHIWIVQCEQMEKKFMIRKATNNITSLSVWASVVQFFTPSRTRIFKEWLEKL